MPASEALERGAKSGPEPMQILKLHFSPTVLIENPMFSNLNELFYFNSGFSLIPAARLSG